MRSPQVLVCAAIAVLVAACGPTDSKLPPGQPDATTPIENPGGCASCAAGEVCYQDACCLPHCLGRQCGDDGCGGSCGECAVNYECNRQTQACECSAESDEQLCVANDHACGPLTATDSCGHARTMACDLCVAPAYCVPAEGACRCDPETDAALCTRLGRVCGEATAVVDNCKATRTVDCGGCGEGETCAADGSACQCAPETDTEFCARLGKQCDAVTAADNCAAERTVNCGSCAADQVCDADHLCRCVPESNSAFCSRLGKACGPLSDTDNCGQPRDIAECGPCTGADQLCSAAGQCVVCTPETDADFCARLGRGCGPWRDLDNCQHPRAIVSCGRCTGSDACLQNGTCGTPASPPANDDCTAPEHITFSGTGEAVLLVDTSLATTTGDGSCNFASGRDVVYEFTLGQTMDVDIVSTPTGADVRPNLYVRTSCADSATQLACVSTWSSDPVALQLPALGQGTYFLWVDGYGANWGNGPQTVIVSARPPPPPPANDLCVAATPLVFVGDQALAIGSTRGATNDSTGSCGWMDGPDVVFSFDLGAEASVRATVTGVDGFQPSVYIVDGCGVTALEKACGNGAGSGGVATAPALGTGTWYVVVDATNNARGDFALGLQKGPAIKNDTCANAQPLVFSGTPKTAQVSSDTSSLNDDATSTCASWWTGKDMVFSFEVPPGAAQNVVFDLTPAGVSFLAPVLSIRSSCDDRSTELGCVYNSNQGGPTHLKARSLQPGTYYLWVDGYNAYSNGAFDLTAQMSDPPAPPANDLCVAVAPTTLALDTPLTIAGTTVDATSDGSGSCATMDGPDVVYAFTIGQASLVTAKVVRDSSTPTWMPALYLRDGCTGSQLACNAVWTWASDTSTAFFSLNELPAGTYYLFVDGQNSTEGAFTLELSARAAVTNFSCASAAELVPDAATHTATVVSDNSFGNDTTASSCNPGGTGKELVYYFTVPTGRIMNATAVVAPLPGVSAAFNPSLRRACNLVTTEIACAVAQNALSPATVRARNLPAGTYYLWVDGQSSWSGQGPFTLTLTLVDAPPMASNDTCANPTALVPDAVTGIALASGDTDTASKNYDGSCASGSGADVVYKLQLAQAGAVQISVTPKIGSSLVPVVYLRRDCTLPATEMGCAVGLGGSGAAASLSYPRLAAGDYYLVVDSTSNDLGGGFDLQVTTTTPVTSTASNDTCASASPMSFDTAANKWTASGNTADGFDDEQSYCSRGATRLSGPDLVYSFELSAAASVTARVTRAAGNFDYRPAVSIRTSCASVDEVACATDNGAGASQVTVSLPQGVYYVVVDGVAGTSSANAYGPFDLEVTQAPSIAADGCGNPELLQPDPSGIALVSGDTSTATANGSGSCSDSGADMVYRLELQGEKSVKITVGPAATALWNYRPSVYVRSACGDPSSELGCVYNSSAAQNAVLTFNRLPQGSYFIWVDSWSGWGQTNNGQFAMTVEVTEPATAAPNNDICARAQALDLDPLSHAAHVAGDTSWALDDYRGSCETAAAPFSGPDLVYSFTLAQASTVFAILDRDPSNSAFTPAIYIRSTTCASSSPADEIGCNTSGNGTAWLIQPLAAGDYFLVVDGVNGTRGAFVLDVVARTTPVGANDTCATAETIPLDSNGFGMVAGTTMGATDSGGPLCQNGTNSATGQGADVVYTFTTTDVRDVTIDVTAAHPMMPFIYVRSACADAATQRACDWRGSPSPVRLAFAKLPAGQYWIWVDSQYSGTNSTGAFTVSVRATPSADAPAHDLCGGAQPLVFDSVTGKVRVSDNTLAGTDDYQGTCANSANPLNGPDLVYSFELDAAAAVTATVTRSVQATNYRPAVYIRSVNCTSATKVDEIACERDLGSASTVTASLPIGTYYVIVDGVAGSFGDFTLELKKGPATVGDNCLLPEILDVATTGTASFSGDTSLAGNSADGTCAGGASGGDFVYAFDIAQTSVVDIAVIPTVGTGAMLKPTVYLRSACTDASPSAEAFCISPGSASAVFKKIPQLPAGRYYLWVDAAFNWGAAFNGAFTGSVTVAPTPSAPVNDVCSGAAAAPLVFSNGVATVDAETWFANNDGHGTCDDAAGPDMVYSVELPQDQKMVVKVTRHYTTPGYQPVVYVRNVCDQSSDVAELTCAKNVSGVATATINAAAQGTYWIWVDGSQTQGTDTPGKFTLEVTLSAPETSAPGNESCPSAQELTLTGNAAQVTGTTVGAQNEAEGSCATVGAPDVVYKITTTADQKITASLTPGAGFYPAVYIRSACGSRVSADEKACAWSAYSSTTINAVSKYAPAGTYWIWVDGGTVSGGVNAGVYTLDVSVDAPVLPPANDLCPNAIALNLNDPPLAADNTDANNDYGNFNDSACPIGSWSTAGQAPETVFSYTPASNGTFKVTVTPTGGNGFDAVVWVGTGTCGAANSCIAYADNCSPGLQPEIVTISNATAGTTYFIFADGYTQFASGPFTIQVTP